MDLAILYGVRSSKVLVQERLLVEDLVLISPPDAPFARGGSTVYLREIGNMPIILPHRPHVLRDIVDQTGIKPAAVIEVDALTLMVELVRAGKGVTLLPRLAVDHLAAGTVVAVPLADAGMNWDLTLCYSSLRSLSEAAKEARRAIRSEVVRLATSGRWPARLTTGDADFPI
jgi:DNA-binding transcriptional LysR family regulator